MKKYEKPALYAETFQLAEHISSGCALDKNPDTGAWNSTPQFNKDQQCSMLIGNDSDVPFFTNGWVSCALSANDTELNCYNSFLTPDLAFSS